MSKNIIRFYRKYSSTPAQLAGKDFEIDSISTDQGMFDKRTSEVSLTIDANLFKLFNGLSRDIEAQVTLSDGTIYVLSDLRQMNQTPIYDFYAGAYNKPGDKFNTKLTFGKWQVYLPHKDETCSTDKHNCLLFDLEGMLRNKLAEEAAYKLDEEICKNLGIKLGLDLGHEDSQTATATMESEKLKSLKYQYTYNKYDIDKLLNEYKPNVYETDPSVYHSLWVDPSKLYTITVDNTNKKEKEKDIMKINNKELKQIIIDRDRKTVTTITEETTPLTKTFGLEPLKKVTVAKASKDDEFDPYVGVAMTLAYQLFGSKENFRKFVRESELVNDVKKNKEAKLAEKEAKKKAAQEAHEKAVARKAEQAKKDEETATELLEKLSKFLNKSKKTKKTKKGE